MEHYRDWAARLTCRVMHCALLASRWTPRLRRGQARRNVPMRTKRCMVEPSEGCDRNDFPTACGQATAFAQAGYREHDRLALSPGACGH
jgi:hypothetical protein